MKEVWIIINDYSPDSGSDIIGCYSSYDIAKKNFDTYKTENNEYGEIQNTDDWDIRSLTIEDK